MTGRRFVHPYEETRKKSIRSGDYEREILGIVSFVFENNLRDEQEELTDILLRNPDPVACRPSNSPVMESEIQDGIMLRIIRMIRDDDLLLTNFILIYEVVLCTMAHGNIKWSDRRDEAIVKMLVNAMENKAHPEPELETVFDCFISEHVPFRSAARKNYIRHLAEGARSEDGRSIRALRNLANCDYSLDRQISELDREEDRTPEESEGMLKNLKAAISFWKEIKDTVPGGKKRCKDLADLLDEYIAFMKNERDQFFVPQKGLLRKDDEGRI